MIGIWLMAIGQVASGYAPNFAALLACRVLEGVGYGLVIAPPGTLTMQWFGEGEWPYINMINFAFGYVGLTAVFRSDAGALRGRRSRGEWCCCGTASDRPASRCCGRSSAASIAACTRAPGPSRDRSARRARLGA